MRNSSPMSASASRARSGSDSRALKKHLRQWLQRSPRPPGDTTIERLSWQKRDQLGAHKRQKLAVAQVYLLWPADETHYGDARQINDHVYALARERKLDLRVPEQITAGEKVGDRELRSRAA